MLTFGNVNLISFVFVILIKYFGFAFSSRFFKFKRLFKKLLFYILYINLKKYIYTSYEKRVNLIFFSEMKQFSLIVHVY